MITMQASSARVYSLNRDPDPINTGALNHFKFRFFWMDILLVLNHLNNSSGIILFTCMPEAPGLKTSDGRPESYSYVRIKKL